MVGRTSATSGSGPLERYIRILEVLIAFRDGLTAGEVARILSLPKTTVSRLLLTLGNSELVIPSSKPGGRYVIGTRLEAVLHSETRWVEIASQRKLKQLADLSAETCFIARRFNGAVQSVAMESPHASVGIYVTPGHDLPWYATASGKLLVALGNEKIKRQQLKRFTPNTIADYSSLLAELKRVREMGYAVEKGEHVFGLATIAVPVPCNVPKVAYALGLTGPEERVISKLEFHLRIMREAAAQLSAILSMRPARA